MGPFIPLASQIGQPLAQAMPSRVDANATPAPAVQANIDPSARATLRTQVATDADPVPEARGQLEEGLGAESRRVKISTEEFAARRRLRSSQRAGQKFLPASASLPPRLAARVYVQNSVTAVDAPTQAKKGMNAFMG